VKDILSPSVDLSTRQNMLIDTLKIAFAKSRIQDTLDGLDLDEVPEFSKMLPSVKTIEELAILKLAGVEGLDERIKETEATDEYSTILKSLSLEQEIPSSEL
jgi:hypothetical protein